MSETQFSEWLGEAREGESVVYFRGLISSEKSADRVRCAAYRAYELGMVVLIQKRGERDRELMDYEYIAVRKS